MDIPIFQFLCILLFLYGVISIIEDLIQKKNTRISIIIIIISIIGFVTVRIITNFKMPHI